MNHLRKDNSKIPKISEMKEKELAKYQEKYAEAQKEYEDKFKVFAKSFHIPEKELRSLLLKNSPSLAEEQKALAKK